MAVISSSSSPPLYPPHSAPHWSTPPHPVIPQERRERKHMKKEWKRNRGAKGFEKVEGGVGGWWELYTRGSAVFGFCIRFVYLLSLCGVSVSFQTGSSAQCPVSHHFVLGSCSYQCGERAPPGGSNSALGALLPLPAQSASFTDPSSTAGRCCCRSVMPTGREKTLGRRKKTGWKRAG